MNPQIPTPGRIVNYVLEDGPSKGQIRPAIVARAWGNTATVQLVVFLDEANDGYGAMKGVSSALYSKTPEPRTWHWPACNTPEKLKGIFKPLADRAYALCLEIEKLPAGEQQTKCCSMASDLRIAIEAASQS